MFNHELYAATLARAVDVMRTADNVEQQKGALRALAALAASSSVTVRCYDGVLSFDDVGIPDDVQHVGTLIGRMTAHGIAEIAIGRKAEPAELLALLRGLADPAGGASVKDRLFSVKSKRIWVLLAEPEDAPQERVGRSSMSTLFEGPDAPPVPGASKKKLKKEDEEALAAWNDMLDSGVQPGAVTNIDLGITIEPEAPAPRPSQATPRPSQADVPPPQLPIPAGSRLGGALMAVARRPFDGNILDRLSIFADMALAELRTGSRGEVIKALGYAAALEEQAPEGTPRNSYRIALRRVMSGETLMQLAPYTADPELGPDVAAAFARAGADGTEALLLLLSKTESIRERKAFMSALKSMSSGHELIVQMLGHHQWFVARNVAELAGEMRLERAAGELGKLLLRHDDQRVRKAAAIALAKIGTPQAQEPLMAALRERDSETRAQIAAMVSSQMPGFALPLAALLESEEDPEALREICLALARIGTKEATDALERARTQGTLFSKRSRALKDAAEQALKKKK